MPSGMRLPAAPGLTAVQSQRGHGDVPGQQWRSSWSAWRGRGGGRPVAFPPTKPKQKPISIRPGQESPNGMLISCSRARRQLPSQSTTSQTCWLFNQRQGLF